ncbi:MAG: hypothetical protein F4099_05505, partial [Synechococcus sp. SB0673_bin_10]|nr:hypothetical protein [Synechococcus sp. SB0673_bin_10]
MKFKEIKQTGTSSRITVDLRADRVPYTGKPGTTLGTLANPTIAIGFNQEYSFTALGQGIDLAANTRYWVVVDVTGIDT